MSEHVWHIRFGMTCCKRCGIVRRRTGVNKPCPGPVRVGLRDRVDADRFDPEAGTADREGVVPGGQKSHPKGEKR